MAGVATCLQRAAASVMKARSMVMDSSMPKSDCRASWSCSTAAQIEEEKKGKRERKREGEIR